MSSVIFVFWRKGRLILLFSKSPKRLSYLVSDAKPRTLKVANAVVSPVLFLILFVLLEFIFFYFYLFEIFR